MSKIVEWAKSVASVCGGWWATMSGGISIPCGILAIVLDGDASFWFAGLAYVSVWVFAIRVIFNSQAELQKLNGKLQKLSDEHRPLELGLSIKENGPRSFKGVLEVQNPSQNSSADEVSVKLLEIEPQPKPVREFKVFPMSGLAIKEEFQSEPPRII